MTRITTLVISVLCCVGFMQAQNISVVSPDNETTVYTDFKKALDEAPAGSHVYLSAGKFENVSYTLSKKLHIVGIGYRKDTGRYTELDGILTFLTGSDGSTLAGVYTNRVLIGSAEASKYIVNNLLIQNCNVDRIIQSTPSWNIYAGENIIITQNIIRADGNSLYIKNSKITNNIFEGANGRVLSNMENTLVANNIFFGGNVYYSNKANRFENNIFLKGLDGHHSEEFNKLFISCKNNIICNAVEIENNFSNVNTSSIFVKWEDKNTFKYTDDYRLANGSVGKGKGTDGKDVGIYGGEGWVENGIPFNPQIESAEIAPQTNADGTLNVKVKVSVRE